MNLRPPPVFVSRLIIKLCDEFRIFAVFKSEQPWAAFHVQLWHPSQCNRFAPLPHTHALSDSSQLPSAKNRRRCICSVCLRRLSSDALPHLLPARQTGDRRSAPNVYPCCYALNFIDVTLMDKLDAPVRKLWGFLRLLQLLVTTEDPTLLSLPAHGDETVLLKADKDTRINTLPLI